MTHEPPSTNADKTNAFSIESLLTQSSTNWRRWLLCDSYISHRRQLFPQLITPMARELADDLSLTLRLRRRTCPRRTRARRRTSAQDG